MASRRTKLPVLRTLHWAIQRTLRAAGYHFEERRSGELKIGLWRRKWRSKRGAHRRLVVIPGFGDTPLSWVPLLSLLEPWLRSKFDEVIYLDLPGYQGFLGVNYAAHTMDLLLEHVADVLDSLKPDALIGHSLGGWLAGYYAGKCGQGERPRQPSPYHGPRKLILSSPAGLFDIPELKEKWIALFMRLKEEGFHPIRPHVFAREPFWFRFMVSEFSQGAASPEIARFIDSVREDHLLNDLLPCVRAKTWLLWGEKDTLVPKEFAEGWMKRLSPESDPKLILLPKVGHSPHLENLAVTAAAIGACLADTAPQRLSQAGLGGRLWRVSSRPKEST